MSHLMLVEYMLIENEPVLSSRRSTHDIYDSMMYPLYEGQHVVRSGCNDAEKLSKHICAFRSSDLAGTDLPLQVSHNQMSTHSMYEVFAGFHEVVRCEMVVLCSCHRFLLKP